MAKSTTVRNKNLRYPVTVIKEQPPLKRLGRAGARLKLEQMLLAVHGQTEAEWRKLNEMEKDVLRQMAREEDPALGVSHQADAIGALGVMRDAPSLLLLSEIARASEADDRLRLAAVHALGEIGGDEVRPVLRSLLDSKATEVRAQAARALGKVGDAADLTVLDRMSKTDKTYAGGLARDASRLVRARMDRPSGQ